MKTLPIMMITATLSAAMLAGAPASADTMPATSHAVLGEKLDSGLGEIAPYPAVVGQKLDSGLGDLPHYRDWSDKTGKAPVQPELMARIAAERK
jgi:hypothetical protein